MIKVASKNKKKRSHSPAKSNNSFVKNVTSTMSYLLPSSITKWFSPSSNSKANGSTPKADATDSSSEDEISETTVVVQPRPKRMRYNSGKLSLLSQSVSEANYSTSSVGAVESYDVIQSASSSRNHFKREPNYVSTPIHTVINEPSSENRERETTVIQTPPYFTKGSSIVTKKRKSLYEMLDKPSTKQGNKETMSKTTSSLNDYSQPYFKASLASSPFYRGKLAYGGAASSFMNQPNIKTSKTTRVNNETSNHDNTISYSTRRVMDLLEHYSSPLSEAKRITPYVTAQNNVSINKTMENTSVWRDKTYKTQELHVPSIASILSLKHRSRLMDTTNAVRQLIASQSSAINCMPYPKSKSQSELLKKDNREKLTTKVKNRITRTRCDNTELVNELVTPIKLPTAILEIDQNNLPKFNFGNPVASTPISVNVKTIRTISTTSSETKGASKPKESSKDVESSEIISSNNSNSYKFATPVIVSRDLKISSQVPKFTFEDPMKDPDTIDNNEKKKTEQISTTEDTRNVNTEKSKDWKCSECWVNNKADASNCVCCSAKQPGDNNTSNTCPICHTAVTKGTGQDKCSKCKELKKSNVNSLTPLISSQNSTIWKCGDCWVDNSETAEKCVCCGFKNPKLSEDNEKQPNAIQNDWKCNDCWVKNKHNVEKCIACGGVKPKSASSTPAISLIPTQNLISSSFSIRDKTFDDILKTQTDKWECSNCLVRNDNEKTKCICCDTEKTGVIKEAKTTNFNFGMNTGVSFKFGINPKAQVDNSNKDMESEECIEQSSTKDKWETNNNILPKTPTFTFGLPVNKCDDKNKSTLLGAASKAVEVPQLNFSFGIPKQTTNETASNIIQCNIKEKESTPVAEEKFQEVPSINFTYTPAQNVVSDPKNLFTSKKSSQESLLNMPNSTSTSGVEPGAVTQENSIAFKPLIVQTTTGTETSKANTFTFAQTGLRISSNLFSAPSSTIANASSSNNSGILPVPITTSAPIFKKSDLNMSPAVALFQRVESSSSNANLFKNPATTSSEATASIFTTSSKFFSFGSNTQTPLPEPSQPKFNFSFGNTNNTDTTPVFNATFGINKDSNTSPNSNKFTLSTANNGGSNPLLPGSSLVSGNLITAGNNPIMSNNSSGNNGIPPVNPLHVPDLGNNSLNTVNSLKTASNLSTTPSNGIFGGTGQKESMWSNTNRNPGNLFVSNATTISLQRPGTFTFGSSTPFNANNNAGTAFGNNTSNVFAMQNPSTNLPTLFSNPLQRQAAPSIFGNQQTSSSPAPTMGVFGNSNPPTNSFNVQSPPIPTFEPQAQNPVPAPTFNFGSPQVGTGVFGFGQQQPQQQFQSPVYNFGASQGTPQFNMGSAPNTTVRRVRKAVRRTQR